MPLGPDFVTREILCGVDLSATMLFATSLLAIMNPISSAVLFATTTARFGAAIHRQTADQSSVAILIILLVCAWAGQVLLQLLGITVPMLQAAGGMILLITGLRMVTVEEGKLTAAEQESVDDVPEAQWKTLAVVPIAIPGTVGAGTITTVVVQSTTYSTWIDLLIISARLDWSGDRHVAHVPIGVADCAAARPDRSEHRDARHGHPGDGHGVRHADTRRGGAAAGTEVRPKARQRQRAEGRRQKLVEVGRAAVDGEVTRVASGGGYTADGRSRASAGHRRPPA